MVSMLGIIIIAAVVIIAAAIGIICLAASKK